MVDAGTATTFDLLRDGVFAGGLIAPGMAFAAQRLGETGARLAPVPFGPAPLDVGRSTAAALAAGGWHAGQGGVRRIVDGLLQRYGALPVVVTGGLGGRTWPTSAAAIPIGPCAAPWSWARPWPRISSGGSCQSGRTDSSNSFSRQKRTFSLAGAFDSGIFRVH